MLREYQEELIDKLFKAYSEGYNAPCIVLPCGGGKSIIVAEIAKRFTESGKTVLFLVHRKELCEQIYNTFLSWGVNMNLCQIVMVQTAVRRLAKYEQPDLIITDENHHSLAKTYKKIYDYFKASKRVGVTATPERLDGSGLQDVNDILIEGVTAKWLIDNNYLSPYDYYAPAIKMPKFHTVNGDFSQSEVTNFFNKQKNTIYGDVIKHYKRLADGKQAICYLPTVEFSKQTAEEFTSKGIPSAHIDGTTPKAKRDAIISAFRNGEIKILCNVDIISEGFDVPDCECVILLRPTKSLILFIQQAMRCMRYKPDKRAIIIDHVNNIQRFGFPDREREWLLEGHKKEKQSGEAPVKQCPHCLYTVHASVMVCPNCEHEFEKTEIEKRVDKEAELKKITAEEEMKRVVSNYFTAQECKNVEELKIFAKLRGYKPGWVYYQQKMRGWLNNGKDGNVNTKRYPCRAIQGWNS